LRAVQETIGTILLRQNPVDDGVIAAARHPHHPHLKIIDVIAHWHTTKLATPTTQVKAFRAEKLPSVHPFKMVPAMSSPAPLNVWRKPCLPLNWGREGRRRRA